MSEKLKSATKLPELRVVLFIVFGLAAWLFLVAGMAPIDQNALASAPVISSTTIAHDTASLR